MLLRALGVALAVLVGDVLRIRRAHVEHAMLRAGIPDASRTARGMYRALGVGLIELLAMALRGRVPASVRVPVEAIQALRGTGQISRGGAVVATAHTGNWDLVACAVAATTPLTVVTKRLRIGVLDRLWQGARGARGLKLVEVGDVVVSARAALRRGELVAMLVDQAPERDRGVVRTAFLGGEAWVDLSPALLAMRARVPLVVAFPVRREDGALAVEIAAVLEPPSSPTRAWAGSAMLEVTRLLEAFVRRHPEQWLWMHRRWKPRPGAESVRSSAAQLAGTSSQG